MRFFFLRNKLIKLKIPLVVGICIFLISCSSNLVYKNLDWVVPWFVDDYVSLNKEQMVQFKLIVNNTLAWHKSKELPRYQAFLDDMLIKLDDDLSVNDIDALQSFAKEAFGNLQEQSLPSLLTLFKTLDSDQQSEFWKNQDEKQNEYKETYLSRSDSDYINDLNEGYIENSERLLGSLSDAQKLIILKGVSTMVRADSEWLNSRQAWLDNVKRQYENQDAVDLDTWKQQVKNAWVNRDQHYSKEDKIKIDLRDNQAKSIMLKLANSRTEKQTQHAKGFIDDWKSRVMDWQE